MSLSPYLSTQLDSTRLDSVLFLSGRCLLLEFVKQKVCQKMSNVRRFIIRSPRWAVTSPRRNGHASKLFASAPFIVLRWSKHCPLLSIWVTTWAFPIWIPIVDRFQDLGTGVIAIDKPNIQYLLRFYGVCATWTLCSMEVPAHRFLNRLRICIVELGESYRANGQC